MFISGETILKAGNNVFFGALLLIIEKGILIGVKDTITNL